MKISHIWHIAPPNLQIAPLPPPFGIKISHILVAWRHQFLPATRVEKEPLGAKSATSGNTGFKQIVVRVLENGPKNLKSFWKGPWLQTLRPIGPEVARTKWTQHLGLWGQRIKFFTSYANILPPGQYSFTLRTPILPYPSKTWSPHAINRITSFSYRGSGGKRILPRG